MPKYSIEILPGKKFEELAKANPRYSDALNPENPSLAFMDKEKGKIYARYIPHPELMKQLINHEIDHVFEEHATDEDEHGIRHKKVFKSLAPILGGIAGGVLGGPLLGGILGPILGSTAGGIAGAGLGAAGGTTAGNLIAGNTKALGKSALISGGTAGAIKGLPAAFAAFKPGSQAVNAAAPSAGAGGEVASKIRPTGLTPGASKSAGAFFGSPTLSASSQATNIAPQLTAGGAPPALTPSTPAAQQPFSSGGIAPPPAPPPTPAAQAATNGAPAPQGAMSQFGLDKATIGRTAVGAGISGLGQLFSPTPKVPDLGNLESINQLRSQAGQPMSDVAKLATQRLTERLSSPFNADIESGIHRQFDQMRRDRAAAFKQFRPNADLATDSAFRQAMDQVDQLEAQSIAQAKEQHLASQAGDISTALGIDTQTYNQLSQLAQLDVYQIMAQTGLDAQAASEFKQAFANIGAAVATPSPKPYTGATV